jgi:hypothetical protein
MWLLIDIIVAVVCWALEAVVLLFIAVLYAVRWTGRGLAEIVGRR